MEAASCSLARPWCQVPHTFNEDNFELKLPSFTGVHGPTPVELLDGKLLTLTQTAKVLADG